MSYASTAVNGVKQATTTTAYANAVKNLSLRQAELALSTKNLSAEQQKEILVTAGLIKETGTLTMAQATEALATDTRNAADVEALMLKAGLITELGAETTATITVGAAKLKELVDTKVLTQAEAELLAMKAGVTLQSTEEAATLIASNAKLGSSFAIMGKTAGAALKSIGTGLLSFASAHPLIAALVGVVSIVGLVTTGTKKLREEQEQAIETARSLQEEYRSSTKSLSDNISSLESQKDEFERLSKGVDDYGKNISLSSDEYDRYKSIVSEILGYSPELIQGYDAEGNAIANKNSLIERSIELMKEEQRQKLKEMTTDEKTKTAYEGARADWQQTKGYEGASTRNDIARWFNDNAMSGGWNYEFDIAKILGIKDEWREEGNNLQNAIIHNIETVAKNIKEKKAELLALKDGNGNALFTEAEIDAMIDQADTWQQQYADWQQDIEDAKHGMDNQFELYAQKADGYNDLTDAQKAFVNEYIKATGDIIDADGNLLSEDEIIKKAEGYTKFVEKLANDPNFEEARTKINTLFSLDKSKMSASEYEKQVNAILKELQDKFNLTDDEVMDFKIALGFTFISDGKTQTGELLDQVKGKLKDEFDGKADELTLEELQIAAKIVADIPEGTLLSWDELQDKIKETQGNADKMTVSLSDLKSASDGLKILGNAFKEMDDDGRVSLDTLESIKSTFGDSVDDIDDYIDRLVKAKSNSKDFNDVLTDLTYGYINQKMSTEQLANANEAYIATLLDEVGVSNSVEVAQHMIAVAKEKVRLETEGISNKTEEEIIALANEEGQTYVTRQALIELAREKVELNATKIDTDSDVQEILNIAKAAGIGVQALEMLEKAKPYLSPTFVGPVPEDIQQTINDLKNGNFDWNWDTSDLPDVGYTNKSSGKSAKDVAKEKAKKEEEFKEKVIEIQEDIVEAREDYAEKVADINEDLLEKEQQFAEDMAEAWKKEHLEQLKDGLAEQEDIINKYKENLEIADFGLDLLSENDFGGRSDLLTSKLEQLTTYGMAMRQEFERVASIIPQTGEEAQELANRLTQLGEDMRENVSSIRETKVAIQQLRIDAYTSVAEKGLSKLGQELDNIDRRLEILNGDNADDFKYTTKFLNMDSLLPVSSDFDDAKREKERQDRELIQIEQTTQDTINDIVTKALEMQSRENAAAREKERQNLIRDMEKARQDAAKKLAEAQKDLENAIKEAGEKLQDATEDYKEFLEDNKIATDSTLAYVEKAIADADLVFPKPDTSQFQAAVDDIIAQIGVVKTELSGLEGATGTNGNPPAGSTSWFNTGADGHAGINDGKGGVWHNSNGVLKYSQLSNMKNYMGWGWSGGTPMDAATAKKIVEIAQNPSKYNISLRAGYCQRFVSEVYGAATGKNRYNFTKDNAKEAAKAWIISNAKGTPFHPGGLAMVGDENWLKGWNKPAPELAIYPDGTSEVLGEDGVEIRDLPRGTQVIPAKPTKKLLNIPNYAEGTVPTNLDLVVLITSMRHYYDSVQPKATRDIVDSVIDEVVGGEGYFNVAEFYENQAGYPIQLKDGQIYYINVGEIPNLIQLLESLQNVNPYDFTTFMATAKQIKFADSSIADTIKEIDDAQASGTIVDRRAFDDVLMKTFFEGAPESLKQAEDFQNIQNYVTGDLSKNYVDNKYTEDAEAYIKSGINSTEAVIRSEMIFSEEYNKALTDTYEEVFKAGKPYDFVNVFLGKLFDTSTPLGKAFDDYIKALFNRDQYYYNFEEHFENRDWIVEQAIAEKNKLDAEKSGNVLPLALGGSDAGQSKYEEYKDFTSEHSADVVIINNPFMGADYYSGDASMNPLFKSDYSDHYEMGNIGAWMEDQTRDALRNGRTAPVYYGWERVYTLLDPNDSTKTIKVPWQKFEDAGAHPAPQAIVALGYEPIEGYEGKYGIEGSNMFINKDGQIIQRGQFATTFYDKENYSTAETVLNADAEERIASMFSAPIAEEIKNISWENAESAAEAAQAAKAAPMLTGGSPDSDEDPDPELENIKDIDSRYTKEIDDILMDSRIRQRDIDQSDMSDDEKAYALYGLAREVSGKALDKMDEFYEEGVAGYIDYLERVKKDPSLYNPETIAAWDDLLKKIKDTTYDIEKDALSRKQAMTSEVVEDLNLYSSKLGSMKTLLETHHGVINAISDAQHELDKDLETSMAMREYLDEDTRKLLFNEDDYEALSDKLASIQKKANKLQKDFNNDILSATEENMAQITSEYQMQYNLLMKSYEVAKADLEVAKKKQQLNNVLNERNVRMFINGSWQWVANTEDVTNALSELADAEYNAQKAENDLSQTEDINQLTRAENLINTALNYIEKGSVEFNDEIKDINKGLSDISLKSVPSLDNILDDVGDSLLTFVDKINIKDEEDKKDKSSDSSSGDSGNYGIHNGVGYDRSVDYYDKILNATNKMDVIEYNKARNAKILGDGMESDTIKVMSNEEAIKEWEEANKHASGTRYTPGGLTLMGEEGFEAYIGSNGRLIPIAQPTIGNIASGGVVFNQDQMKNLRTLWDMSNLNLSGAMGFVNSAQPQQIDQSQDNRIIINGMTVDSGSADGQALINALRRYVGNH